MISIKEAEEILKKEYVRDNFEYLLKEELLPDYKYDKHPVAFSNDLFAEVTQLGESSKCDISIFEVILKKSKHKQRVTITQEMFKILRSLRINNAIVSFVNHGNRNYRISLLTSKYEYDGDSIIRVLSNPRRFSYSLGYDTKTKTAYKYLIGSGKVNNLNELIQRFSVEVVNKQFYSEIATAFTKLVGGERNGLLYDRQLNIRMVDDEKKYSEFAVRLIGRIMFCWFLKEKKSKSGVPLVHEKMLSCQTVNSSKNYYHDILEPLFFELLNTSIGIRKPCFRSDYYNQIPYLNGGLFSPQGDDFYRFDMNGCHGVYENITIPNSWFNDLYSVLSEYNFTVDENTAYDIELSIDPEMLGRIFENLLAEINPETGENAKKDTGSFYTPRDIVDYMVDSSLLEYLKSKTTVNEEKLRAIISYSKEDDEGLTFSVAEKKQIINALYTVTILDPACGSGAFPIGMLQKIVYVLQEIDYDANLWFDKATENVSIFLKKEFEKKFNDGSLNYIRKLSVIQNSIFGIDIQPIAVEISRLRCFLSLIIEEKVEDDVENRGINPLPNLDFKFIIANSLIPIKEASGDLFENIEYIQKLKDVRDEYFNAESSRREDLKREFISVQQDMLLETYRIKAGIASGKYEQLFSWKPFENQSTDWFDPDWMFGIKDGFNIIIGNPPYIKERGNHHVFEPVNKTSFGKKYHQGKMNYWYYFLHKAIDISAEDGVISFITHRYWLNSAGATDLIKRIKDSLSFTNVIDIGKLKVFDNVVGFHMIAVYSKKKTPTFIYKKLIGSLNGISSTCSSENVEVLTLQNDSVISKSYEISFEEREEQDACKTLGTIADVSQGVVEASDSVSAKMYRKHAEDGVNVGDGIFVLTQSEIDRLHLNENEKKLLVPYADGECISRYRLGEPRLFLIYSDKEVKERIATDPTLVNIKNHLDKMACYITSSNQPYGLHRPRKRLYFESVKIVMPSMFKDNDFIIDYDKHVYVGMSHSCIVVTDPDYLPEYILAVLNSSFARTWFYSYGKKRGAGVDIGVEKIRTFPIKKCDKSIQQDLASKVKLLMQDYTKNKQLDREIDEVITELYSQEAVFKNITDDGIDKE